MRSFGVELLDEVVGAGLLLLEIVDSRFGRLALQCEMHAFMTAVLLRVARLDPLDRDAWSQPPDSQPGQV